MKHSLLTAFLAIVLISCQKEDQNDPVFANEKTELDVAYGTDAAQKMDIYLPSGRTSAATKVIVLIHGGGWSSGDKSDFGAYIDTLKKRLPGYAIFNINYRLANGTTNFFPTQENDVKAALEYIFNKRTSYGISEKFVLLGTSAGAHLALLQAYKYPSPIRIRAVVDFFGPTDMTELYNNPASPAAPPAAVAFVVGGTPVTHTSLYQQSSPVTFVSAQSPPTIVLQGGADPLVAPAQAVALNAKLQSFTITYQYVFYPAEGHGWIGATMSDSFDKITAFLAANVN